MKRTLLLACLVVALLCLVPTVALADGPTSNWTAMAMPSGTWTSISFPDQSHGFATGSWYDSSTFSWVTGFVATTDGGATWSSSSFIPNMTSAHDTEFIDAQNGWVCGGKVLRTTDAGLTWTDASPANGGAQGVDFVDTDHGIEWGSGYSASTTDGGASWAEGTTSIVGACLVDQNHGWAVTGSSILRTTDGGRTWDWAANMTSAGGSCDISFADALHGYCVSGYSSYVGTTTDGGATWAWLPGLAYSWSGDKHVLAVDASRAWVADGDGNIWATDDNGADWVRQRSGNAVMDTGCIAIQGDSGWFCGEQLHLTTGQSGYSDLHPPVTTCEVPAWIRTTTAATFSATDDKTSVAGTWYQLDGAPWTQGTSAPLVVDPLGLTSHHLLVASQDGYGNWETPQEFYTHIDVTGPRPVVTPKVKYMMDYWYNKTSSITMSGTDQGVGGGGVKVKRGTGAWIKHPNGWVMVTRARTDHRNDGAHPFKMCAYDDLGNVGKTVSHTIYLDTRRPTATTYPSGGNPSLHSATYRFIVHDKSPSYSRAIVVIKVKNMSGKLLGGYESFLVKKNRTIVKTLYCPLPAGHYRFSVIAGDGAGNVTRVPSTSSLTMGSMAGLTAETPSGPRFMPAAPSASDLRSLLRMHLR